jgi:membrane protein YqaA with SNARE-associated domain
MIGEDIISLFASLGDGGMLLAIAVIILIDGVGFPTIPEVWIVFIFGANPDSLIWGIALVLVASLSSLLGNFALYKLVKIAKLPTWIQRKMRQYTNFLIVKDERLLLLNRIAPVIPYTGAFIAACGWNLKRSAVYLFFGAIGKFSVIVVLSWLSFDNLREDIAPWVSIGFVAVMLAASLIISVIYRKRMGVGGEPSRSQ